MQRFRIFYAKNEGARYTGNLDMQKIWERSLRRAKLPVAYSQGFHPQPKIQQGCPLPLGYLSRTEIVDVWLNDDGIEPEMIRSGLETAIPAGIEIRKVEAVDLRETPLQARSQSAEYRVEILEPVEPDRLCAAVDRILNATTLPRTRRKKTYDLRPLIEHMSIETTEPSVIRLLLAAREGATGRVEEVLDEIGIPFEHARITRTGLFFAEDTKTDTPSFEINED